MCSAHEYGQRPATVVESEFGGGRITRRNDEARHRAPKSDVGPVERRRVFQQVADGQSVFAGQVGLYPRRSVEAGSVRWARLRGFARGDFHGLRCGYATHDTADPRRPVVGRLDQKHAVHAVERPAAEFVRPAHVHRDGPVSVTQFEFGGWFLSPVNHERGHSPRNAHFLAVKFGGAGQQCVDGLGPRHARERQTADEGQDHPEGLIRTRGVLPCRRGRPNRLHRIGNLSRI